MSDGRQSISVPSGDRFLPALFRIVDGRIIFAEIYCREKGWDKLRLTGEQWSEITDQPGWKNPVSTRKAG